VSVPLDTLTQQEARRTRALLAAQSLRPGTAATPPAEPLRLSADAVPPLCRLTI
jgi:hypothetical protein